jgi:hypothetical protein
MIMASIGTEPGLTSGIEPAQVAGLHKTFVDFLFAPEKT